MAVGRDALTANTTGTQNVAIGNGALSSSVSTNSSTCVGFEAGKVSTEGSCTAFGWKALVNNTSATLNAGFGRDALGSATTGGNNSGIGFACGYSVTSGTNNSFLGADSGRASSPFEVSTQSNRIVLGNNSITNAYIKVAWTVTSDARDKTNIGTVPHSLDFVNQLNPVSFQFKTSRENDTPSGNIRYGFLAQDILELEGDNNVIIDNEQPDKLKYQGESLVPVLVNAIKELSAKVDTLQEEVNTLKGA